MRRPRSQIGVDRELGPSLLPWNKEERPGLRQGTKAVMEAQGGGGGEGGMEMGNPGASSFS